MKRLFSKHNLGMLGVFLFVLMTVFIMSTSHTEKIYHRGGVLLTEGWEIYGDKESLVAGFQRVIDEDIVGQTIVFRSYDAYTDAYIDDESIYHFGQDVWYLKSPGSAYHFIDLPTDSLGKTLRIEVTNVYESKYITDYDFKVGSGGMLVAYYFEDEGVDFIFVVVLMALGLLLLLVWFTERYRGNFDNSALLLSGLTIGFVVWSPLNGFYFQVLVPSAILRYYVYYFLLYVIPLMMINYTETVYRSIKCHFLYYTHGILILVLLVLHFTKRAEMTETLVPYCGVAFVELAYMVIYYFKKRKESNKYVFYAFVFWVLTIGVTAVLYAFNTEHGVGVGLSEVGLFVYMSVNLEEHIRHLVEDIVEAKNAQVIKKQAYTDQLTGVGNRRAFDERLRACEPGTVTCFSMDVNFLKYYNDTFGHACGDRLIIATAEILTEVFGDVYRTGGDEFIALIDKKEPAALEQLKEQVHALSIERSTEELKIRIACGYSNYHVGDASCEEMVSRADAKMYEDKKALKSQQVVL